MGEYYNDYLEFFSTRIAKLRMAKDVSAREMSFALAQSESYIGSLERKQSLPSMTVFLGICDYFGITPKEFFDDGAEFPAIIHEIMLNLKGLDAEQLTSINSIVKSMNRGK